MTLITIKKRSEFIRSNKFSKKIHTSNFIIQKLESKDNRKILRNLESPSTISTKSAFSPRPFLVSPTPSVVVNKMFTNKNFNLRLFRVW